MYNSVTILICGGRDYGNVLVNTPVGFEELAKKRELEYSNGLLMLDYIFLEPKYVAKRITVVTGGAKGGDTIGKDWALKHNFKHIEFFPEWDKYGKSAGFIRNKQMLDEGKPDFIAAFPGGAGTEMMKKIGAKAEVKIINIPAVDDATIYIG